METEIILHRGYKGKHLENSRAAFENALKEDMSFETDIRTSRDERCFMIHDEKLDRLLNAYGKVIEYNAEDLRKMRYKENNSNLVSFEELLEMMKNSQKKSGKAFIHIKKLWNIKSVMNCLNSSYSELSDRLRFFACDDLTLKLLNTMKDYCPGCIVGLHFTQDSPYKEKRYFEMADFIWADEITKENITPEVVSLAHSVGKPIYAISPELIPESMFNENIEQRWKELISMKVDGICTDKPSELEKFLSR